LKIVSIETRFVPLPLARPYSIAYRTISDVEIGLVVLRDEEGRVGLGASSPATHVTGETLEASRRALSTEALAWLHAGDPGADLAGLLRRLGQEAAAAPAARAAIDMALHDLWAQARGLPLCEALGRRYDALPTSITIGIKTDDEAVREADEYTGRGFTILKVKLGRDLAADLERIARIRASVGPRVAIRADANQGYSPGETRRFFEIADARALGVEFLEQPVPAAAIGELAAVLSPAMIARVAADESLHSPADAESLVRAPRPAGIFNIKLMKCGGVGPALEIARTAARENVHLMWGCMDESRIGIAAALHGALACPATRYLDLDGSLDLARDVAEGGFEIEDGRMRPAAGAGLGVRLSPG
jgi:L-alanine-DL-glutamate epimerase-like enolase superfamily enzyme